MAVWHTENRKKQNRKIKQFTQKYIEHEKKSTVKSDSTIVLFLLQNTQFWMFDVSVFAFAYLQPV